MGSPAFINALLEGVRIHTERQLHQKQMAIDQQRADAQTEGEKARIDQQKQQLEESKRQFDAQHELAAKAAKLTHLQQLQQITAGYSKTGLTPPGTRVTPTNPEAGLGTMTFPGMGLSGEDISAPIQTPQAAAAQAASTYEIANKPIEEKQIRVEAAKQGEIEKAKLAAKREDLDRMNAQKQYDDAREERRQAAEMAREKLRIEGENYRARLAKGGTDTDLTPYISQAHNGELTQEDIRKLPLKPNDQMRVLNGVIAGGGKVLKQADKQSLLDMSTIGSAVPNIDAALQLLKDHPIAVRTPGTAEYKQYQEAIQQVELVLPQVGRVIAGDKGRMSNQQIQYAHGSFLPSRNPMSADYSTNVKNRNDFVKTMKSIIDNHTLGMKPGQKALLLENYQIPDLGEVGTMGPKVKLQSPDGNIREFSASDPNIAHYIQQGAKKVN